MRIGITKNIKYIDQVVNIHISTFNGFFLTFLGKGFLRQLYRGFMEHPQSGLIIALDGEKLVGFCAYSENLSNFYKYLVKRRLYQFAWYALGAFMRNPKIFFRLLKAFTYSNKSKRAENYIELSSIGVSPDAKNKGIGSKMIRHLYDLPNIKSFDYIKLETDRDNNEGANHFYKKNGFVLHHCYETSEGRRMNEYRFYLGETSIH